MHWNQDWFNNDEVADLDDTDYLISPSAASMRQWIGQH